MSKMLRMTEEEFANRAKIAKVSATGKVGKFREQKPVRKYTQRIPTEHEEQAAVIVWADQHPIAKYLFAIPNGSHKSPAAAAKFKREGLRSGIPDLFLPVPRGVFCGLFLEMKRTKGSVTSKEQFIWLEYLNERGYKTEICKGADEAIATIKEYLGES